jgi:arabinose-5-phosphate isomerase
LVLLPTETFDAWFSAKPDFDQLKAEDVMSLNPIRYSSDHLALDAFKLMNEKEITQLIITHEGRYAGILHMHQLIQEGLSV